MDGNGRWAVSKGLARNAGHRVGVQALKNLIIALDELEIRYFSTQATDIANWIYPHPFFIQIINFLINKLYGNMQVADLDEACFSKYLYTAGQPDPDLLIRPSGEMRVSNFLLWQIAYSEFWVTNILWPDFRKEHLWQAIWDYQNRKSNQMCHGPTDIY